MKVRIIVKTTDGEIHFSDWFETEETLEDFQDPQSSMSRFTQYATYRVEVEGLSVAFNPAHIIWVTMEVQDDEKVTEAV